MLSRLSALRADRNGSTIVEFAILAPIIIGMMIGVVQIGVAMQAKNAMRGVASDTARYAVIQYMKETTVTDAQIKTQAETIAAGAPYLLQSSRLTVTVTSVTTPRVAGTFEKTLTITYTPPSFLPFFPWTTQQHSFSRPIFVIDE